MGSATRRTTTIGRSHARDHVLLVLPGLVLLAGLVFVLSGGGAIDGDSPIFRNFVSSHSSDAVTAATDGAETRSGVGAIDRGVESLTELGGDAADAEVAPDHYVVALEDEEGRPVAFAKLTRVELGRVSVASAPDGGTEILEPFASEEFVTDENGEAEFPAPDGGSRYEIRIELEGYATKHYRLRDPGHRYPLKLHRSAMIAGQVFDNDLVPQEGVTVELWHDRNRRVTAVTDETGHYEFGEVTPTMATLRVNDARFRRASLHCLVVEGRHQYFRDIKLERGRRLDVTARGPKGGPLVGAEVRLVELDSGLICGSLRSDEAGLASFECLDDSRHYMVIVRGRRAVGRSLVPMAGGDEDLAVAVPTRAVWALTGVVRTLDGLVLPGTQVIVESEAFDSASRGSREQFVVVTDDEGRFYLDDLDPDLDYAALVYHQQFAMQQLLELTPGDAVETDLDGQPLPGAELVEKNVVLGPAAIIEGILEGPDQEPLGNSVVYLSLDDDQRRDLPGGQISVRTDSKGHFSITNLGEGHYQFQAVHLSSGLSSSETVLDIDAGQPLERRFVLDQQR